MHSGHGQQRWQKEREQFGKQQSGWGHRNAVHSGENMNYIWKGRLEADLENTRLRSLSCSRHYGDNLLSKAGE